MSNVQGENHGFVAQMKKQTQFSVGQAATLQMQFRMKDQKSCSSCYPVQPI